MSRPDAQARAQKLQSMLWRVEGLQDVLAGLRELQDLEAQGEIDAELSLDTRLQIYSALSHYALRHVETVDDIVLDDLLPLCMRGGEKADSPAARAARQYRQVLVDWLAALPAQDRYRLRDRVLDEIRPQLASTEAAGACWTIANIGFRRSDITSRLWNIVESNDGLLGDVAIACLASLGVPSSDKTALVTALLPRANSRRNVPLLSALREVAAPETLEVVTEKWLGTAAESEIASHFAVRILADIADADAGDADLQDKLWSLLEQLFDRGSELDSALLLGGDLIPRCNSPKALAYLLSRIARNAEEAKSSRVRELACIRLAECLRPRQLEGWGSEVAVAALAPLREDAASDTENPGRAQTAEGIA